MSLAEWVWLEDDAVDVSPELCIQDFPVMNGGCWSRLLVKFLGIGIILGACLNKFPMIYNICTFKSTQGLSSASLYADCLVVGNSSVYGILMNYPFTAYGEALALLVQSLAVVALQWIFAHPPVQAMEKAFAVAVAVAYVAGVSYALPEQHYYILMASMWPIQIYAKGAQIYESFRVQHTGAQAIITLLMNITGSAIRILTTLKEVGWDMAMLTGALLSVALNGILLLQYIAYRKNTKEFIRGLEKKKAD